MKISKFLNNFTPSARYSQGRAGRSAGGKKEKNMRKNMNVILKNKPVVK